MGGEASTFCSASKPGGYNDRKDMQSFPPMPSCGANAMACGHGPPGPKRMPIAGMDSLRDERINAWTKDLGPNAECSQMAHVLTCGSATSAPMDYLADTQDKGAILLDSHKGPIWMDDECEDQKVIGLEPGEMSMPEAAMRRKDAGGSQDGPMSENKAAGRSLQMPAELDSGRWRTAGTRAK
mmetsp:Transcript_127858/g.319197  ORF Transcript_127858/g.319197 Transcript_127858/m.319197 type:complete len:182 (+) Transcript_127858:77-622(+)